LQFIPFKDSPYANQLIYNPNIQESLKSWYQNIIKYKKEKKRKEKKRVAVKGTWLVNHFI
jgi:hypothetical protein